MSMLPPSAALALVLGVGGAIMIGRIVEGVNDRLLAASVRVIADTLAVEEGELTLDLPPFSLGMLENDSRDNVYYSVREGNRLVTGYGDLPTIERDPATATEIAYSYARYRDMPIRIAAVTRQVPRIAAPVTVQVAETMTARSLLKQQMLVGLVVLELVLLAATALLLPLAVRFGLSPLATVRDDMARRAPDDFTPLPLTHVPAELGRLVAAFNNLLGRLENAVQGMRSFTADASHQMRTPLSILQTHLSVLRREGLATATGQASLVDIETATERLRHLLVQLIALARAESTIASDVAPAERVDLVELVRKVAVEFAPAALKAEVDLVFEDPEQPIALRTVSALATELVGNLVDNAIRYNRPGGEVVVRFGRSSTQAFVVVEDDGPGIPAADREAAFARFRRFAGQQQPGSGLGLAIAKALAEAMGATVALESRDAGPGLVAKVVFPLVGEAARQERDLYDS
jgi:two-component system sensor histidine kinase TctE